MAILCETSHLLALLNFSANEGERDALIEQIYTTEPDPPLLASRSFDNLLAFLQMQDQIPASSGPFPTLSSAAAGTSSSSSSASSSSSSSSSAAARARPTSAAATAAAAAGTKTATTATSSTSAAATPPSEPLVFQREAIVAAPAKTSLLSQAMANVPRPPKKMQVKLFLPYGKPLALNVLENITAIELIRQAIKQHASEYRSPSLDANPLGYDLLLAEKDGTIDDTLPIVSSSRVADFGRNFFLQPKLSSDSLSASDAAASSALSGVSTPSKLTSSSSDGASSSSSSGGAGSSTAATFGSAAPYTPRERPGTRPPLVRQISSLVVKINLPDGTKTTLDTRTAGLETVGEIVSNVCLKRGLDPSFYYLTEPNDDLQLGKDMTLNSIGGEELVLRSKPGAPPMTTDSVNPDQERLSFKSFTVSRIPSRTMHRFTSDAVNISFDKDRLWLERKKKKSGFNTTEISRIVMGEKPNQFSIAFASGKEVAFNAPSAEIARDIQSRLEFIIAHARR